LAKYADWQKLDAYGSAGCSRGLRAASTSCYRITGSRPSASPRRQDGSPDGYWRTPTRKGAGGGSNQEALSARADRLQVRPRSKSCKGNYLDNAALEIFFATLKSELFHINQFDSVGTLKQSVRDNIHYYDIVKSRFGCEE